eukprot:902775-Pelagomonas_calceolata.AAC.5
MRNGTDHKEEGGWTMKYEACAPMIGSPFFTIQRLVETHPILQQVVIPTSPNNFNHTLSYRHHEIHLLILKASATISIYFYDLGQRMA